MLSLLILLVAAESEEQQDTKSPLLSLLLPLLAPGAAAAYNVHPAANVPQHAPADSFRAPQYNPRVPSHPVMTSDDEFDRLLGREDSEEALTRRDVLQAGLAAFAAGHAVPSAHASYALGQAAQDTLLERQKAGDWKPGSDVATLKEIQGDIAKRRPEYVKKKAAQKQPFFCAGERSVVQPQYENLCETYGLSKADQAENQARKASGIRSGEAFDEFGSAYRNVKDRRDDERREKLDPSPGRDSKLRGYGNQGYPYATEE